MEDKKMTTKQLKVFIVLGILILAGLWKMDMLLSAAAFVWGIILPFVLGGAIAFIINVPMSYIEKKISWAKKYKRACSLVMTIAIVIAVITLVIFFLVPQLGATFVTLGDNIAVSIPKMQAWLVDVFNNNEAVVDAIRGFEFNVDEIVRWGMNFLGTGAGNMMNTTFAAARSIVSGVTTFFIAFSFACYILIQKENLRLQARKVLYAFLSRQRAETVERVCSLTFQTFSRFLSGQCLEALILGGMFVVVMSIIGMPYALLIGVLIAFTALIPIFGAFIGCGVGAFLILMVSPKQALIFVILFLVLQQIEGNFIYPHVVGNSVGLPSIWVLAAVSVGGNLMGIVGMLIFIPAASVAYTLFREVVYKRLKEKKINLM